MARLPYAEMADAERVRVAERVVQERGSLLHLYRMLLHSAPVAEGWLDYLTAIRQKSTLPGDVREMVIMLVAHLNGATYEADQHRAIALQEGMSEAQLACLQDWEGVYCFSPRQRAVLAYTDAMTRNVQVPDPVFEAIGAHFPPSQMVELTATIAAYNMVSRFLEALRIHSQDNPGV